MGDNFPYKESAESLNKQEIIDEVCKRFESVVLSGTTNVVPPVRVSSCPAVPSVDGILTVEEPRKHKRRRGRRMTKVEKYSSSDEETVASDDSFSVLMDLLIWFNKRQQEKNSSICSSVQSESSHYLQESTLEQNVSKTNGAVPKIILKPKNKKKRNKLIEDYDSGHQGLSGTKQQIEVSKKRNDKEKQPEQIAGEIKFCSEESPHLKKLVPDVKLMEPKASPKKLKKKSRNSQLRNNNKEEFTFKNYLTEEELQEENENGFLIEGVLRINQKNFKEAYIHSPDKGPDILIDGVQNRNRALEGDEVFVRLKPPDEWRAVGSGSEVQKSAEVLFIKSKNHPRTAVGILRPMTDKNHNFALFSPRDSRMPRMRIPISKCPEDFIKHSSDYSEVLFLATVASWFDVRYAVGELVKCLGPIGNKDAETTSILLENEIDVLPYPDSFKEFYPETFIIEEELSKRLDMRKECIFTIDPLTARDLDDALSCKKLENGNFEIGVHISDVTYFLAEGTPLDVAVRKRATSTYLVDEVYHMLPRDLCMLCSLLPGNDRITFSVFWEVNAEAEVLGHRFARTIINSCVQLAYEHAQEMIERPEKVWNSEELPTIHNGFSPSDLVRTVQVLNSIAIKLRRKRFSNGALRIDQTKLIFNLHPIIGLPVGFSQYISKQSHRLIEEFMLLANVTVAKFIKGEFPDVCFLRMHSEPHSFMMKELQALMGSVGIHLDISTAGTLQNSLTEYAGDDMYSMARMMVLNSLCAKPMARAKYFCGSFAEKAEDFWHYALSVPLYTHFTSPIRRYADVMVHRLLAAALGYIGKPNWDVEFVHKIAANCNKQKFNAKRAGEQSNDLFLAMYVAQFGPLVQDAVVLDVKDHSFDVVILSMGCTLRIYTNVMPDVELVFKPEGKVSTLELHWRPSPAVPASTVQIIQIFSIVKVVVACAKSSLKLEAHLLRPELVGPPPF